MHKLRQSILSFNHGSSRSSAAVFRFSGTHCNIEIRNLIKRSFLLPSRFSSSCARLVRGGMGTVSFQSPRTPKLNPEHLCAHDSRDVPWSSKNSGLLLPRFTKSVGGGPSNAIISARCARVEYPFPSGSCPENSVLPSNKSQTYTE